MLPERESLIKICPCIRQKPVPSLEINSFQYNFNAAREGRLDSLDL